ALRTGGNDTQALLTSALQALGNGGNSAQSPMASLQQVLGALQNAGQTLASAASRVSPQCREDLYSYQTSLQSRQLWALQMLDASGKPRAGLLKGQRTFVGDYDECMEIVGQPSPGHVVKGHYCGLAVSANFTALGLAAVGPLLSPLIVHVCVPHSCNNTDLFTVFQPVVNLTNGLGKLEVAYCTEEIDGDPTEDSAFWIAIGVMAFLALLCSTGTVYGVVHDWRTAAETQTERPMEEEKNGHVNVHVNAAFDDEGHRPNGDTPVLTKVLTSNGNTPSHDAAADTFTVVNGRPAEQRNSRKREDGVCSRLLLSFSVLKNGSKLLSCHQTQGELSCLHGIRVLSITWVVLGHAFTMQAAAGIGVLGNAGDTYKVFDRWTMGAILSGTLSVDTFFLLSGCLTAYLFLRQTKKAGGVTCFNMIMYYVHRFWRLTPLYMFAIAVYVGVTPYLGSGPFQFPIRDRSNCRHYWWQNLLYVNNVLDLENMCFGHSWYLADDMQFYFVAPLVVVPWALGHRAVGMVVSCLFVLTQLITAPVLSHIYEAHSFFINNGDYMKYVYFPPWTRAGPFAIGLMLGYALYSYNRKFRMQKMSVFLGWLLAVAVGLTCVYVNYDDIEGISKTFVPNWSIDEAAVYEGFSRPAWACAVAWVIFACCTGYGGFVNTLLSWRAWAPLSRLTYGVYLFHLVIFYVMMANLREPFYLSAWNVTEFFLALTVLSYLVSFVASLLVESPTLGVEKILLGGAGRKK
ncbi:hypothetical protein BaRGS_00025771, partial [Batillaria attramentaria]